MDTFDLYGDLEEFDLNHALKDKEAAFKELEKKYNEALENVDKLGLECKNWKKKFKNTEKSFWSLLETCRAEIRRKDSELDALKKQRDDIIFRRISNRGQINENYLEKKTIKTNIRNEEQLPFNCKLPIDNFDSTSDYRSKNITKNTKPYIAHCNDIPSTSVTISQQSARSKYEQSSKAETESRNRNRYYPYSERNATRDDLTLKNSDRNKMKSHRNENRMVKETEERLRDKHQTNILSSSNEIGSKKIQMSDLENANQKHHITGNKNYSKDMGNLTPVEKNNKLKKSTNCLENKRCLANDCKIASDSVSEMLKQIRMEFEKQNEKMETTTQENQNTEIYKRNKPDESEQGSNAIKLHLTEKKKVSKIEGNTHKPNIIENEVSNSNTLTTIENSCSNGINIEKNKNFKVYNNTILTSPCSVIENSNNADEKICSNSDEKRNKSTEVNDMIMTKELSENMLVRKVVKNDSYPNNFKIKIINFPFAKVSSNDLGKSYKIPKLNKNEEMDNKLQISEDFKEQGSCSKEQVENSNPCSLQTATNNKNNYDTLETNCEGLNPNVKNYVNKNTYRYRSMQKKNDDVMGKNLGKTIINEIEDNIESKHENLPSHNKEFHKTDTQNREVINSAIASITSYVKESMSSLEKQQNLKDNLNFKAALREIESDVTNIGSSSGVKSVQLTSESSPKCISNSINTETLQATEYLRENMMLILEGKPSVNSEAAETENISNNQKTFEMTSKHKRDSLTKNNLRGESDSNKIKNDESVFESIQIAQNEIGKKVEKDNSLQNLKKTVIEETKNSKNFLTKTKEKPRKIVSVPEKFINSSVEYQKNEEKKISRVQKQLDGKSKKLLSFEDINCINPTQKNDLLEKFNRSAKVKPGTSTTDNDNQNKNSSLSRNENKPSGNKQCTKKKTSVEAAFFQKPTDKNHFPIEKIKVKNNITSNENNNFISVIRKKKTAQYSDTLVYSSGIKSQKRVSAESGNIDEIVMSTKPKKRRIQITEPSDIRSNTVEENNTEINTEFNDLNGTELDLIKNQYTPLSSRKSVRIAKKIQVDTAHDTKLEQKNNSDLQINKMSQRDEELFDCMFKSPNKHLMISIPDNNLSLNDQVEENFKKIFDSPLQSQIRTISENNNITPETKLNNSLETTLEVKKKNIKDEGEVESEASHNTSVIKNISTTTSKYQLIIDQDKNSQVDESVTWLISRKRNKKKKKTMTNN